MSEEVHQVLVERKLRQRKPDLGSVVADLIEAPSRIKLSVTYAEAHIDVALGYLKVSETLPQDRRQEECAKAIEELQVTRDRIRNALFWLGEPKAVAEVVLGKKRFRTGGK